MWLELFAHHKITSTLRMLCYSLCGDAIDKYYRTCEIIVMGCLRHFCLAIRALFKTIICTTKNVVIERTKIQPKTIVYFSHFGPIVLDII